MFVSANNDRPVTAAGSGAVSPVDQNQRAAPAPAATAGAIRPAAASKSQAPNREEMENAVKTLNKFTEITAQDVRFSIDEESGKTIVKVVDVATQTVLRQIPNVEALSISRSLHKMQGLLVRDSA
jgi:flagellar protein FlaG